MWKNIHKITTIVDILLIILCVVVIFALADAGKTAAQLASDSVNYIDGVDPDSVVAGYQVLGGVAGTLLAGFGAIMIAVMQLLLCAFVVNFLVPVIIGIITWVKSKKEKWRTWIKVDAIIKIIFHALPFLLSFGSIYDSKHINFMALLLALFFAAIESSCIYTLVQMKKNQAE